MRKRIGTLTGGLRASVSLYVSLLLIVWLPLLADLVTAPSECEDLSSLEKP
ncbi:MAG: hypothetical protein ACLP9L_27820 [Thermoguttaceae bacterium]